MTSLVTSSEVPLFGVLLVPLVVLVPLELPMLVLGPAGLISGVLLESLFVEPVMTWGYFAGVLIL